MELKEKKWEVLPSPDQEVVKLLSRGLDIHPVIARILVNREIRTVEAGQAFLDCSLDGLTDPFTMHDMDRAVARITAALAAKEKIMIYGDYDVDGITSIALLYKGLCHLGGNVIYYVPNRLEEGYGMSFQGIYHAQEQEVKLIVSVDCGITAVEEVIFASDQGIDIVVTDHHEPGASLPPAYAVLDPKRSDSTYLFKELAGVGIAFKLLQAIFIRQQAPLEVLHSYLDLVALGTVADIVPLVGENRILVRHGMTQMEKTKNVGIKAMLKMVKLDATSINTGQIVFVLAPRLNAGGRLGDAEKGIKLLVTDDEAEAQRIAGLLETENRKRKDIDSLTFKEADEMLKNDPLFRERHSIVLFADAWHVGVIGIVASRMVEKYYLPAVLVSFEDGLGRGSARSIPNFDIYAAFHECSELLTSFGGHKYAAGLSIQKEQMAQFKEKFDQVVSRTLSPDNLVPKLVIDTDINLDDIDTKLLDCLTRFAQFGPRNMRPVFVSTGVQVVGDPQIVGNNHLKFKARQNRRIFDVIGFDMGDYLGRVADARSDLSLVYTIEENEWNNEVKIQLRLKGLK